MVYKLDSTGHYVVLHAFARGVDGFSPYSTIARDSIGNLYGTTPYGGAAGCGIVYKLDSGGHETLLHNFGELSMDGQEPRSTLSIDSSGNIYGATPYGGAFGNGTLFKIDAVTHQYSIVYSFDTADGSFPNGPLLVIDGNIYGTTDGGGESDKGVIFKITPTS